jgi:phosphomannomutase/phosphoglucomutase
MTTMDLHTDQKPELPPKSIFRAYDIRGIYGRTLTPESVVQIGRALGSELREKNLNKIIVARDGRLSSPILFDSLTEGLLSTGCNIIDIGLVPTPLMYYASHILDTQAGVMITGSHNPANYNGFKIVINKQALSSAELLKLYQRIVDQDFVTGEGHKEKKNILDAYVERVAQDVVIKKPVKVVVDAGNGIAGQVAPKLLRRLGCEVINLFCDVDGHFPNHPADPSNAKNLETLIKTVKQQDADLGVAFDGDGDRLGVITNRGENIYPDRQMMLFAKSILPKNPNATIIFDIKCSRYLPQQIETYKGRPLMWKTGHSLIKSKMFQENAVLAGEMSGHLFFNDRWYGFDDGIYAAARLIEILSQDGRDLSTIFHEFPDSINTPELKLTVSEELKFHLMTQFIEKARFPEDGEICTIDGIRVDFADGWGLMRPSNTTPYIVFRFEAENQEALKRIQGYFREQLLSLDETLNLPF